MKEDTEKRIEDLLKPRYKVVADYPWNGYPVGLVFEGSRLNPLTKSIIDVTKYPHLFKKLEWWEDRELEEMPKFLRVDNAVFYCQYRKDFGGLEFKDDVDNKWVLWKTVINHFGQRLVPATEQEYNDYIDQTKINSKP